MTQESRNEEPTRRAATLGAAAAAALALGAGAATLWTRKDISARLFNPMRLDHFALGGVEGLAFPDGAMVPALATADLAGRTSILNLFASWCPSCRDEHALLIELAARDVAPIYGVDVKDRAADARAFLRKRGNPYRAVGADPKGYLQRALGARGIPATFVVAPGPVIEIAILGELDRETIEEKIIPALTRMG